MFIRRVTITNIRRFGAGGQGLDLALPSKGWIVVAGPNGCGKTTFLRAVALALSPNFDGRYADTLFAWKRKGTRHSSSRLVVCPEAMDEFQQGVEVFSEKAPTDDLTLGDDWEALYGTAMSHGREAEGNRAFTGPWHHAPKGWFTAGYGALRRLVGQTSEAESYATQTSRESAFVTLFRDDASLLHSVRWLMKLLERSVDPEVAEPERQTAHRLVHQVIEILDSGLLDGMQVRGDGSEGLTLLQDGHSFSLTDLGTGAQILVATVIDILRHIHARFGTIWSGQRDGHPLVKNHGVVIIDEAESHLHPWMQRRLGFWFREHFPEIQFLVSTHSPFVCQAASENGLVVLPSRSSDGPARVADRETYNRAVNGSVDDALLSGLFGLDQTWSDQAAEKRLQLARLEARVLAGNATQDEQLEYRRLRGEVPDTLSAEVERVVARTPSAAKPGKP